jgi:hypothetical protein
MTSRRSSSRLSSFSSRRSILVALPKVVVLAAFSIALALSTVGCAVAKPASLGPIAGSSYAQASSPAQLTVCFSPRLDGGCDPTATIVAQLDAAQRQVLIQAYEFTSAPIAKAVVDAKQRGVDVRVILDKVAARGSYTEATFLKHAGVPVFIDYQHGIAHNKVIVIDGRTVLTGSFNFTKAAEEHNAENLLIIDDPSLAAQYTRNWQFHAAHSQQFFAASDGSSLAPRSTVSSSRGGDEGSLSKAPADGAIVGNRRSHIYALPGCPSYDKMAPGNRVTFPSAQAAEAAGYRLARNCT